MNEIALIVGYGIMFICLILGAVVLGVALVARYGDAFVLKAQLNERLMKDDEMFERYVQMLRDIRKKNKK